LKYEESPDVVDNVIHLLKEHWKIMEPRTPSLIILDAQWDEPVSLTFHSAFEVT
jgi:hypothetical protein